MRLKAEPHNCYKINLRKQSYELIHTIENDKLIVCSGDK